MPSLEHVPLLVVELKKINNQSFKKRKVKNSEPISQIKRNYVKVKKTVMN